MTHYHLYQDEAVSIAALLERIATRQYPHLNEAANDDAALYGEWFERGVAMDAWNECIKSECADGIVNVRTQDHGVPARPDRMDEAEWRQCVVAGDTADHYVRRFGDGAWQRPAAATRQEAGRAHADAAPALHIAVVIEAPGSCPQAPADAQSAASPTMMTPDNDGIPRVNGTNVDVPARTAFAPLQREDPLRGLIMKIIAEAPDPIDRNAMWDELMRLAQLPEPPAPLLGYVPGEGVQWDNGEAKFLTKAAFKRRVVRLLTLLKRAGMQRATCDV